MVYEHLAPEVEDRQFSAFERFLNPYLSSALRPVFRIARFLRANCAAAAIAVEIGVRAPTKEAMAKALNLGREIALSSKCGTARARSAVGIAYLLLDSGDYAAASRLLAPELPAIRALGDSRLLVEALLKLGTIMLKEGWPQSALDAWTEGADVAQSAGYEFGYMAALDDLGGLAFTDHRDTEAKVRWITALEIASRRRDALALAKLNRYLAVVDFRLGDVQSARIRLNESAEFYERAGQQELAVQAKAMARDLADSHWRDE